MEFFSNEESVLECREYLSGACLSIGEELRSLKVANRNADLELLAKLKISDEVVEGFVSDRHGERVSAAELTDLLMEKFSELKAQERKKRENLRSKQASVEAAMDSVTAFFRAHDEAEQFTRSMQPHTATVAFDTGSTAAPGDHKQPPSEAATTPHLPECNYALMAKLPGQWNSWTGNTTPSEDLAPFLCTSVSRTAFARETIRIPFKASVWQRSSQKTKAHGEHEHAHARHHGQSEVAGGEGTDRRHVHRGTGSPNPDGVYHRSDSPVPHAQLAYGAQRLFDPAPGTYWSSFTMTECMMASPFYQHLSTEKFRALEHFSVLRTFRDQETIVQHQQRFFNIYYVRQGRVRVLRPCAKGIPGPGEVVQILQGGDLFGFECLRKEAPYASTARYTYRAMGPQVQCYAVPVEYFSDLCLKEHTAKSIPMKVAVGLSAQVDEPSAAQINLARFALTQQETTHVVDEIKHTRSALSATALEQRSNTIAASLLRLDRLLNPEYDFAEVVDEFLNTSRDIVNADRACLYVINRQDETARFYALPVTQRQVSISNMSIGGDRSSASGTAAPLSPSAGGNAGISVGDGVALAISGLLEHVVQHATVMNIANFSTNELYDPSIEKRTCPGRKVKHLLLTPVYDGAGRVIAVLQYTNPKNAKGEEFNAADVEIAQCIASKASLLRLSAVTRATSPVHSFGDGQKVQLSFHVDHLLTERTNRHLRMVARFYLNGQQYGPDFTSPAVATYNISADQRRCDFKQDILIPNLFVQDLPQAAHIVFAFESTNKHPIAWGGIHFFDYQRRLRQGEVRLTLWDGAVPDEVSAIPALLEGFPYAHDGLDLSVKNPTPSKFLQCSTTILTVQLLELSSAETLPIVHMTPSVVKYALTMGLHNPQAINPLPADFKVSPVPMTAGARAVDWYVRQMTPSESNIFSALNKIIDVVQPVDLDSETCRLLWRMRNALCAECPWAMLWFVLSWEWTRPAKVDESCRLLYSWADLTPLHVLPLLDSRFRDGRVRAFAANFIDALDQKGFQNVLGLLVFLLRYEQHDDSALARLLLKRALHRPETTGKLLLWHLHSAYVADPVVGAHYHRLLMVYLRSLSDDLRGHQTHGLYALTRLDAIYRGLAGSELLNPQHGRPVDPERTVGLLLSELNQNPWPSEFATPVPSANAQHSTGVVECTKLPNLPHTFVFTLKYPDLPLSRFVYSLAVSAKVELLYQQLLRAVDLVWTQESVPLTALCYEAVPVGPAGIVQSIVPNAKAVVSLAARAVNVAQAGAAAPYNDSGATPAGTFQGFIRPASVPNSVITDFLRDVALQAYAAAQTAAQSHHPHAHHASTPATPSKEATVKAVALVGVLARNLAGFAVLQQALGLKDANPFNTIVTPAGRVFVQNPGGVLGIDAAAVATGGAEVKPARKSVAGKTESTLFFPRYFDHALGVEGTVSRMDFANVLSVAFLALRKHAAFLVWTVTNVGAQLGLPATMVTSSVDVLKERLLLRLNDEAALQRLKEIVRASTVQEPSYHPPGEASAGGDSKR